MSIFFQHKWHDGSPVELIETGSEVIVILPDSKNKNGLFKVRRGTVAGNALIVSDPDTGYVVPLISIYVRSVKNAEKTYMEMVQASQIIGMYSDELMEKVKLINHQAVSPKDFLNRILVGNPIGEVVVDNTIPSTEETPVIDLAKPASEDTPPAKPAPFDLGSLDLSMLAPKNSGFLN